MVSDPLRLRADLLLLLTAIIWGFAFVAQRTGMAHVEPFTFNAVRFLIGGLALLPVLALNRRQVAAAPLSPAPAAGRSRAVLAGGLAAGAVMFGAATLQQMGIVHTTAGKAGFITSLYVVLVPLLGLALGHRPSAATWAGAILAAAGLYFLTMQGNFRMAWGDLLVLLGAVLWAGHMLLLGRLSPGRDPIRLAFVQFLACAALSGAAALALETTTAANLRLALGAILFTGILSVGVGYTLQVVGQRHAPPADAAILLSMEALFAVIGGRLLLGEHLTSRALLGCGLMLAGILVSQWPGSNAAAGERRATGDGRPHPTDT
jgi:drug/metabolite transporter (DMT)-like permease